MDGVIPQGDVIVVENRVDCQCVRHVHLMSNQEVEQGTLLRYAPSHLGWLMTHEIGAWHYRADYPYHGMLDVACVDAGRNFRRLVVWHLGGCKGITQALHEARLEFCRLFGGQPQYGFIRKLPARVENGHDVEGMILVEAEWMLERCVAVGGRQSVQ